MYGESVDALDTRDKAEPEAGTVPIAPSCRSVKESRELLGSFEMLERFAAKAGRGEEDESVIGDIDDTDAIDSGR